MRDLIESIIYEEIVRACNEKREILHEIYKQKVNGVMELGRSAVSKKRKYAKRLWSLIQKSYAYIGDDGFYDFLNGDYIWRIYFGETSNDILGAFIYKHTNFGRKRVCSCAVNREVYNLLNNHDMTKSNHTYAEVSGKPEHIISKDPRTNWVDKNKVSKILRKDIDVDADDEINKSEFTPYDAKRHYYRTIGGTKHRKAMFGNPIDI